MHLWDYMIEDFGRFCKFMYIQRKEIALCHVLWTLEIPVEYFRMTKLIRLPRTNPLRFVGVTANSRSDYFLTSI